MKIDRVLLMFVVASMVWTCKKDDAPEFQAVPPRLLSEVTAENDAEIQAYLQTHFYNYEEFENLPADFDYKIRIDTLAGDNANKTPLSEMAGLKSITINISSENFGIDTKEENIPHKLYYLSARDGMDESVITVADSTYVRYEGRLLNDKVFDGSLDTPIWFDLAQIQGPLQGARGFTEGIANFKAGGEPIINDDGTFSVEGYGVGLIIFPSGLGYFNNAQARIPAYSPLIFKIDVFAVNETDHDGDGIPSIMEDVNGNGYLYDDNTDEAQENSTRSNLIYNFLDADDDGDGTLTRNEIVIDAQGNVTFPDSDGDGIPDYLDKDTK